MMPAVTIVASSSSSASTRTTTTATTSTSSACFTAGITTQQQHSDRHDDYECESNALANTLPATAATAATKTTRTPSSAWAAWIPKPKRDLHNASSPALIQRVKRGTTGSTGGMSAFTTRLPTRSRTGTTSTIKSTTETTIAAVTLCKSTTVAVTAGSDNCDPRVATTSSNSASTSAFSAVSVPYPYEKSSSSSSSSLKTFSNNNDMNTSAFSVVTASSNNNTHIKNENSTAKEPTPAAIGPQHSSPVYSLNSCRLQCEVIQHQPSIAMSSLRNGAATTTTTTISAFSNSVNNQNHQHQSRSDPSYGAASHSQPARHRRNICCNNNKDKDTMPTTMTTKTVSATVASIAAKEGYGHQAASVSSAVNDNNNNPNHNAIHFISSNDDKNSSNNSRSSYEYHQSAVPYMDLMDWSLSSYRGSDDDEDDSSDDDDYSSSKHRKPAARQTLSIVGLGWGDPQEQHQQQEEQQHASHVGTVDHDMVSITPSECEATSMVIAIGILEDGVHQQQQQHPHHRDTNPTTQSHIVKHDCRPYREHSVVATTRPKHQAPLPKTNGSATAAARTSSTSSMLLHKQRALRINTSSAASSSSKQQQQQERAIVRRFVRRGSLTASLTMATASDPAADQAAKQKGTYPRSGSANGSVNSQRVDQAEEWVLLQQKARTYVSARSGSGIDVAAKMRRSIYASSSSNTDEDDEIMWKKRRAGRRISSTVAAVAPMLKNGVIATSTKQRLGPRRRSMFREQSMESMGSSSLASSGIESMKSNVSSTTALALIHKNRGSRRCPSLLSGASSTAALSKETEEELVNDLRLGNRKAKGRRSTMSMIAASAANAATDRCGSERTYRTNSAAAASRHHYHTLGSEKGLSLAPSVGMAQQPGAYAVDQAHVTDAGSIMENKNAEKKLSAANEGLQLAPASHVDLYHDFSRVHDTSNNSEHGCAIENENEFDGGHDDAGVDENDIHANASVLLQRYDPVFPGAFAMAGMNSRPGGSDADPAEAHYNNINDDDDDDGYRLHHPEGDFHYDEESGMLLPSCGDSSTPGIASPLNAELHQDVVVVDGAVVLNDDEEQVIAQKVLSRLRLIQSLVLCFSLSAITMVIVSIIGGIGGSDGTIAPALEGWHLVGSDIYGDTTHPQSFFGSAVKLSAAGTRLVVSAPGESNDDIINSGAMYVIQYNPSGAVGNTSTNASMTGAEMTSDAWEVLDTIEGQDTNNNAQMSMAISEDADYIAIGYPHLGNGVVRRYTNEGQRWIEANAVAYPTSYQEDAEITADTSDAEASYVWFGHAIDMSFDGSIMAIAAPLADSLWQPKAGVVLVYQTAGLDFMQLGPAITGQAENEFSGWSVALRKRDGLRIAVGSPSFNIHSGLVRVFDFVNDSWIQVGTDLLGDAYLNRFGESLSFSYNGTVMAVGEPGTISEPGQVRVFQNVNGGWDPLGPIIRGDQDGERFGASVALSKDGTTLVIGSPEYEETGTSSGRIQIRKWNRNLSTWELQGSSIVGPSESKYGTSVHMSADCTRVVGGGPAMTYDGKISQVGTVRVFDREQT